ncbi:hypothetical protein ONZ45_g13544 [Pleurotus djamor]|nr:hypothetical protein ONZ45_g13544 [Pleurotus djamor]
MPVFRLQTAIPVRYISYPHCYLLDLHDSHALDFHLSLGERFGHVIRLKGGLLSSDALYITDPLALRTILIKKQESFLEEFAGLFGIVHHGDSMTSVWGAEHRRQRKLINPVFNSANVSRLLPILWEVADQLRARLVRDLETTNDYVSPTQARIELLDHFTRAAMEFVGRGGIGQTFHMLDEDKGPYLGFYEALRNILPIASRLVVVFPFFDWMRKMKPVWLRRSLAAGINYLPWPAARQFKATCETLHPVYDKIFERGKRSLQDEKVVNSEILDLTTLLIRTNEEADSQDRMSDESVKANIGSIIHGGQETASSLLARLVHLLSIDQKLQDRMRDEILQSYKANDGQYPSFAELESLPILDAVCREVLRMYSPVTFIWRKAAEDVVVPLRYPIRSEDHEINRLWIHKGTKVYVGISAGNRSKDIWGEDSNTFNIERWLNNKQQNTSIDVYDEPATPYSELGKESSKLPGAYSNILTFLGGGRSCPGHRFAVLEMKVVLFMLLSSFTFSKCDGDEIDWQLGITLTPYLKGKESEGAKVPVGVALLKHDSSTT